MGFWEQFPYTNFHEMNLKWVTKAIKDLKEYVENYVSINKVAYAGIWDITKQYPQWSIVSTGDKTYMSEVAVPSGIAVDNGDYWIELADLDPRIGGILERLNNIEQKLENIGVLDLRSHNGEKLNDYYDGNFRGFIILPQAMKIDEKITINVPCYILGGGCTIDCLINNCFSVSVSNCTLRGITFTYAGNPIDPDSANNSVIALEGDNTRIESCSFSGFYGAAIGVKSENNAIDGCSVEHLKSSYIAAMWIGPLSKCCVFTGCVISNCYLDGFHVEGDNITICSCKIDNCGLRPGSTSGAHGACGIYGGRTEQDRPVELIVDGCTISNCSESGIDLGSSGGRFINCDFYRNALNGIALASNYRNIISNNIFTENGWSDAPNIPNSRKSTIACDGCYAVSVSNNIIRGSGVTKYAIDFPDGNNQLINANVIENSKGINVRDDSSVVVVNNITV